MTGQEKFFSPNHERLLSVATWAKYLARIILILYVVLAFLVPVEARTAYERGQFFDFPSDSPSDFWEAVGEEPLRYWAEMSLDVISRLLSGAAYYVVLKGVSLGLNMIVETDINYREKERQAGVQ